MTDTYYISITGLVLQSSWQARLKFYYHAIPSSLQAKSAPGNIYANTSALNGYMMTMTIWKNKKAMRSYMFSGAHVQAMKMFNDVASSGLTCGYETNSPDPISWQDAYQILMAKGKGHGGGGGDGDATITTTKSRPLDLYNICAFVLLCAALLAALTKLSASKLLND